MVASSTLKYVRCFSDCGHVVLLHHVLFQESILHQINTLAHFLKTSMCIAVACLKIFTETVMPKYTVLINELLNHPVARFQPRNTRTAALNLLGAHVELGNLWLPFSLHPGMQGQDQGRSLHQVRTSWFTVPFLQTSSFCFL